MSKPQLENGYIKIANELFEQIIASDLSSGELRVMLFIIRKIYGFNKKEDRIPLSQMMEATGLTKVRCSQVVNRLKQRNMLTVKQKCNGCVVSYEIQKAYKEWRPLNKSVTVKQKCNGGLNKSETTVKQKCNPITKDTISKDTCTKDKVLTAVKPQNDQSNRQAKFVEWFAEQYQQVTGYPYKADKKDYIIAAKLLKDYETELIVEKVKILGVYCSGQVDAWFAEGWQDFTIGKLSSMWNNLIPKLTDEQKKAEKEKKVIAELDEQERRVNELLKKTA